MLALDAAAAGDQAGLCPGLMAVMSLLSAAGVSRELLYAAGQQGLLHPAGAGTAAGPQGVDEALERLSGASLLAFGADGRTVAAHRLTMRVAVERAAQDGSLARFGTGTAGLLRAVTGALAEPWQNRPAARDAVGQIMALHEHLTPYLDGQDTALVQELLGLRGWAVRCLFELGDSSALAIEYGTDLATDREQVLGPAHPDTLTSRGNLAAAYQAAGRTAEAEALRGQAEPSS